MQSNTNQEEEKKDSDITYVCRLCGEEVTGPAVKWKSVEITGALMVHLNTACFYVNKYTARVNEVAQQWKKYLDGEYLKPYKDIRSFFSSCNEFLTMITSKIENFSRMKGLLKKHKDGNELNQLNEDLVGLKEDLFFSVG